MSTKFDWASVVDYSKRIDVTLPKTQYELPGVTEEDHDGVPVAVVPLWHAIVTTRFTFPSDDRDALKRFQVRLQTALDTIERIYPVDPTGILIQTAYGLGYFRDRIPASLTDELFPRSTMPGSEGEWAIIDSIRFPKDPESLTLESNDVVFHFKSDYQDHIERVLEALFEPSHEELNGIPTEGVYVGDALAVTTTRRGFAGHGMPSVMGKALGIPGAEHVPAGSMLFMGFTSSHVDGLAQGNLPSFETLPGYTNLKPDDYFAGGTHAHLSHIGIDLERWYRLSHSDRRARVFNPRRTEEEHVLSPSQAPDTVTFEEDLVKDAETGVVGHNAQMQSLSRLHEETTTAYGDKLPRGTVIFLRQDFNTVENPFGTIDGRRVDAAPRAGVHFIGFGPSAQFYQEMRLDMDSHEHQEKYHLHDDNIGFTGFLDTTHRQNLLMPPRAHRALPLAELL